MAGIRQSRKYSRRRLEAARLADQTFDYRRVGFDRRPLMLLSGGVIGTGAAGREISWRLREQRGRIALEIYSSEGLTCRCFQADDKVWRGRWLVGERMLVELTPINRPPTRDSRHSGIRSASPLWPPSLFVVSLPRSLSTLVYHRACQAVGLRKPPWTSDGEILNLDRFKLQPGPAEDACRKFVTKESEAGVFHATAEFLAEMVSPTGYGYKDVVQPFVVSEWLNRAHFRAIRIKRNLADVADSMLEQNWHYPARLFPKTTNRELALIQGLLQAERALDSTPAQEIDFDDLISDEKPLRIALQGLYGEKAVERIKYIDDSFNQMRLRVLKRRESRKHEELAKLVAKARELSAP